MNTEQAIKDTINDLSCELMEVGLYETLVRRLASNISKYNPKFDWEKYTKELGVTNR